MIFQISESVFVDCGHFGESNLLNLQRSRHCKGPKTLSRPCRFHFIWKVLVYACVGVTGLGHAPHWCTLRTAGISIRSALHFNLLLGLKVLHKSVGAGPNLKSRISCIRQTVIVIGLTRNSAGLNNIQVIRITSEFGEFSDYSNGYLHFPFAC